jgi:hypothetical protein
MQAVGRQSTGCAGITSCAAGDWLDGELLAHLVMPGALDIA